MNILILGGTAWLGRHIAATALANGHTVTCLARGTSGPPPQGATLIQSDRDHPHAYDAVTPTRWDAAIDLTRQPDHLQHAAAALAPCTERFVYISTISVYADKQTPSQDEDAPKLPPLPPGATQTPDTYGPAKMACETHLTAAFPPARTLIIRPGLIGGPGDHTGRTGYWPLRFAHPSNPARTVAIPDPTGCTMQIVDVRDLAAWTVTAIESRLSGTFNAVGDSLPLVDHLATARQVANHTGPTLVVPADKITEFGIKPWAGENSFPLYVPATTHAGFGTRSGAKARAAGLVCRPLQDTFADTLAWEQSQPQGQPRNAGLSDETERRVLESLAAPMHSPSPLGRGPG